MNSQQIFWSKRPRVAIASQVAAVPMPVAWLARWWQILALAAFVLVASCNKVPLIKVEPKANLQESYWIGPENTLFVFYDIETPRPLSAEAVLEVAYTDSHHYDVTTWQDIKSLKSVHQHLPVDCGPRRLCGSFSWVLDEQPVVVQMRYRHQKQATDDTLWYMYPVVARDVASYEVFGTFDATNRHVFWQGRHVFPGLSHEKAQELGLRRWFRVEESYYQNFQDIDATRWTSLSWFRPWDSDRCHLSGTLYNTQVYDAPQGEAGWEQAILPSEAKLFPGVCGVVRLNYGGYESQATAYARKNPVVVPVSQNLHIESVPTKIIRLVLRTCFGGQDPEFLDFQQKRLGFASAPHLCLENERGIISRDHISYALGQVIAEHRDADQPLSLLVAFHHLNADDLGTLHTEAEAGLALALAAWPEVVGGLIYDSVTRTQINPKIVRQLIWCPTVNPEAADACRSIPSSAKLGPINFKSSPILPTRQAFHELDADDLYATDVGEIVIRAPYNDGKIRLEQVGEFSLISYHDHDRVSASQSQAFSYCHLGDPYGILAFYREDGDSSLALSLSGIGIAHNKSEHEYTYNLGVSWQFPLLVQMDYQTEINGTLADGLVTIPFGLSPSEQDVLGDKVWELSEVSTAGALFKCERFCDFPAFNSAGIYEMAYPWRERYDTSCYQPQIPKYPFSEKQEE